MQYMNEFLTIALVHLVAVASPGPDFAVVVRNSVAYGRRIAMYTSIGIGLAILLHVLDLKDAASYQFTRYRL